MSRFTINNVLKQIEKHNNPFSFLITDNPQNNNYYDEKISTLEKDLKDIPDNKEKINYLNYFLENNISKEVNDLLSYYLQWKGIDEDKKSFIEKIKNDEGVISFIARIIKEDDYRWYKSYFESYILIYERILYFIENNDKPAINSETDKDENEHFHLVDVLGKDDNLIDAVLNNLKEIKCIHSYDINKVKSKNEQPKIKKSKEHSSERRTFTYILFALQELGCIKGFIEYDIYKLQDEAKWKTFSNVLKMNNGKFFEHESLRTGKKDYLIYINKTLEPKFKEEYNKIYNAIKKALPE